MGSLWWLGDESIRFGTVPLSLTGICSSSIWSRHPPSMRIVGVPACQISVSFYTSFFGGNCAIKPKETTFFGKSARSCEKKTLINTLFSRVSYRVRGEAVHREDGLEWFLNLEGREPTRQGVFLVGAGDGDMDGRDWEKCCGDCMGHWQRKPLRFHIC